MRGRETVRGWLFDAYAEPGGVRVWILGEDGRCRSAREAWRAALLIGGPKPVRERALAYLAARPFPVETAAVERLDLFSGRSLPLLEARLPPEAHARAAAELKRLGAAVHHADIHLAQAWFYERGLFPLARAEYELDGDRLLGFSAPDDPFDPAWRPPPLRTARLELSGSEAAGKVDPSHAARGRLVWTEDGRSAELEGSLDEQVEALAARLRESDPDVLLTEWGDSWLLPRILAAAERAGVRLPLSRDPARQSAGRPARSFMTFGRMVYQASSTYLFGRWHLDLKNSFALRECGMDGLLETARLSRIPVQRAARCTIGTALSSMQMRQAFEDKVLVPADKAQAEDFRPADMLLFADKGGLVYEPEPGWLGEVVEYDFVSMYPALMVDKNISPETVNCPCCPENLVPEAGHHLCLRRRGLVPKVLAPMLRKRAADKALGRAGGPEAALHKRRADAHKWALVCCFGYLGFKNARFGKIEAHECVNAWGRETLLRAKEAAERRGLRMLHALVDSLWLQGRPGLDYEALRREIEGEAGCALGLEGVYRWLRFCPSRRDSRMGVPGRYFGAFQNGELKIRGLALRRRDSPELVKSLQRALLSELASARSPAECSGRKGRLEEILAGYLERLEGGRVSAPELAISASLSQEPSEYRHDTLSALAAKALAARGVALHAGETVRYVINSAKDEVADWRVTPLALLDGPLEYDEARYAELLRRAAEEVWEGL